MADYKYVVLAIFLISRIFLYKLSCDGSLADPRPKQPINILALHWSIVSVYSHLIFNAMLAWVLLSSMPLYSGLLYPPLEHLEKKVAVE